MFRAMPPTDSVENIIIWFRREYQGSDVEDVVKYLMNIMSKGLIRITDFVTNSKNAKGIPLLGTKYYQFDFKPEFTPDVLIRMGVFGGLGIEGIENTIPIEWILFGLLDGKISYKYMFPSYNINYFKVVADPYPLSYEPDLRTFFHWFCGYYLGKRSDRDVDMIKLWKIKSKTVGKTKLNSIARQTYLQWSIMT